MTQLSNETYKRADRPIEIMQFGEGNFLRAFIDWMIQKSNDKGLMNSNVVVVQPLEYGRVESLKEQDGLYTLLLEGIDNGETISNVQIIDSLDSFINPYTEYESYLEYAKSEDLKLIFSNTTEAGIVLDQTDTDFTKCPKTYPGKLLSLLKTRYDFFSGAISKGLEIVPCELIDNNGSKLKEALVKLSEICEYPPDFIDWLGNANHFANTLVDRIVPGYPKDSIEELQEQFGYVDNSIVKGEVFHLFVVEGSDRLKQLMPFDQAGLNCLFVDDIKPYKERKVKILNGLHTSMVPVAYLYGIDTVREAVENEDLNLFLINAVNEEIIPTIQLSDGEKREFSESVIERFKNPFIRHELLSISLNSCTKYVTRILPSVLSFIEYEKRLPKRLMFALASLIVFYKGERDGNVIPLKDDRFFLELFKTNWNKVKTGEMSIQDLVESFIKNETHFGYDLRTIEGFTDCVTEYVELILSLGMKEAVKKVL